MSKNILLRLMIDIFVFGMIIFGYWWIGWILLIVLLFFIPLYLEIIFFGVLYDALYGISLLLFWNMDYIFSLLGIVLFSTSLFLKKRLSLYE